MSFTYSAEWIQKIRDNLIGEGAEIPSPFGKTQRLLYADYTASGRAVKFIEDYIRDRVLPFYGNTHTTTSFTGAQTTKFREEARKIIADSVGALTEDQVLFVGSGSTAAINLLVRLIFPPSSASASKFGYDAVIFLGPYEHHSNILPWITLNNRGFKVKIVYIYEDQESGGLDLNHLKNELLNYANVKLKIGSFNAASNLTGILTDTIKVTKLLKEHKALSFWDYAAGAPYLKIEMNPKDGDEFAKKDAIFFSTHKFVGGVGGSGILVVKKSILLNNQEKEKMIPTSPGGGTVAFVSKQVQIYHKDPKEREESGTPNILGDIRAGLAFQLKNHVGAEYIEILESNIVHQVIERLSSHKNIIIHGNVSCKRIPIISLNILCCSEKSQQRRYLHHNFICALLNDLFGIQARGGCACAGPYTQSFLSVSEELSNAFVKHVDLGNEILKAGVARISFSYLMSSKEIEFICSAIEFIATHGWKFLGKYRYELNTARWFFHALFHRKDSLHSKLDFEDDSNSSEKTKIIDFEKANSFKQAELILQDIESKGIEIANDSELNSLTSERWFAISSDFKDSAPICDSQLKLEGSPFSDLFKAFQQNNAKQPDKRKSFLAKFSTLSGNLLGKAKNLHKKLSDGERNISETLKKEKEKNSPKKPGLSTLFDRKSRKPSESKSDLDI